MTREEAKGAPAKSVDAYRTISEVAADLDLPQHVLRFWETRFPQLRPLKRAGGRRFYRPADVALLRLIRAKLYDEGYTIKGVQRLLRERGGREQAPDRAGLEVINHNSDADAAATAASPDADAGAPPLPGPAAPPEDKVLAERDNLGRGDGAATGGDALRELLDAVEACERRLRLALDTPLG